MKWTGIIALLFIVGCSRYQPMVDYREAGQGISVGDIAPNIALPNPDGDTVFLNDLRGKVVLIDFWASWCGPCRHENPNLVATYQKYRDAKFVNGKGFTIYSVSLDNNKNKWSRAIEKDSLTWPMHGCDFQGWKGLPTTTYQVRFIPMNWLIDKNGVILATNLRGDKLDMKLDEYLKSF